MFTDSYGETDFSVLLDQRWGYNYEPTILAKLEALLQDMTKRYSKALFIRFDVRFPYGEQYPEDNVHFRTFMATFMKHCQRKGLSPAYLWVREQDSSIHQHYHCVLLVNGHKAQKYRPLLQKANSLWQQQLNTEAEGLIHFCDKNNDSSKSQNGVMLKRGAPDNAEALNDCFKRGSYLAKTATKDDTLYNTRSVGNSRISAECYASCLAKHTKSGF